MTRRAWLVSIALLVGAIWLFAPHRFTDADTLSRLATGRYFVTHAALPQHDPFTFARPEARLGHAEWLGDVVAYGCYTQLGERGLQTLVIALVALGYVLAFACAIELGAPAALALALLLLTLSAAGGRFSARNDVHALWLLPLFMYALLRGAQRDRTFIALGVLGAVWSNLHSSFVLGWALLLAAFVEQRLQRAPLRAAPVLVLIAYPLLPLLGPVGTSSYAQLWDHLIGAPIYRSLIVEWASPLDSPAWLAILPLHVLCALGLAGIALARPRPRWLAMFAFALGVVLVYGSLRFLSLMAALLVPAAASGAGTWFRARPRALRTGAAVLGGTLGLLYLALGLRAIVRAPYEPVFERPDAPLRPARFIAAHGPSGARLFNSFDDGPWLLWLTAPRVQHYVDPRNHLGAGFLRAYVDALPDPVRFEQQVARSGISLVLVRGRDPGMQPLAAHLAQAGDWPLVYWDGEHAVHARRVAANAVLIERFAYHVLRPSFDVSYLAAPGELKVSQDALMRELERLRAGSAAAAMAIEAEVVIEVGGADLTPAQAGSAAAALRSAIGALPPSDALVHSLRRALQAAGRSL